MGSTPSSIGSNSTRETTQKNPPDPGRPDKGFLKLNLNEDSGYLYSYDFNPGDPAYYFGYRGSDPALSSPSPFKPETHEKDPVPAPIAAMVSAINQTSDADFTRVMADYMDLK